jgi:hypothetical protein
MSAIDLWQRLRVGFIAGALLLATACTPETETSAGDAVLSEIINNVQVGGNPGKFEPAKNGTVVAVGSLVRSGENSLAKLAFSAGSFVRFSSNTAISRETPAVPEEVRFKLEAGRLRLSLFGHLFAVQTPLGLIQLDGFGDVNYQIGASPTAGDDALSFKCFAGPCLFQSDVAAAYVQLNSLEGVLVEEGGQSLTRLTLSELDLRQFILDNPGSVSLIATLTAQPTATSSPTPTSTVTRTPTFTFTPSSTPLPETSTPTASATRRPTRVVTFVPASTGTITATATETETPTPESGGGGGEPPPATSTSPPTPVPPTNTPVPPTNTPEPTITPGPSKTPG